MDPASISAVVISICLFISGIIVRLRMKRCKIFCCETSCMSSPPPTPRGQPAPMPMPMHMHVPVPIMFAAPSMIAGNKMPSLRDTGVHHRKVGSKLLKVGEKAIMRIIKENLDVADTDTAANDADTVANDADTDAAANDADTDTVANDAEEKRYGFTKYLNFDHGETTDVNDIAHLGDWNLY